MLVEGNIGSGKSSLLNFLNRFDEVHIFPEPVEDWRHVAGYNLLELMYSERRDWVFPFENYALLTTLRNHTEAANQPIKIMERSIFSHKNCFWKISEMNGSIHPATFQILNEWYSYLVESVSIQVDLVVYLRTSPQISLDRIVHRGRIEEANIDLRYVNTIHDLHESWLNDDPPAPVIILDANLNEEEIVREFQRAQNAIFNLSLTPARENV